LSAGKRSFFLFHEFVSGAIASPFVIAFFSSFFPPFQFYIFSFFRFFVGFCIFFRAWFFNGMRLFWMLAGSARG
jgi:hypothetical protein